jgi:hypothetical protein
LMISGLYRYATRESTMEIRLGSDGRAERGVVRFAVKLHCG